jgi:lysophospholipase L1-like esterase
VVTLGDSITDGYGSTVDANRRWPNVLAQRLQHAPHERGRAEPGHQRQPRAARRLAARSSARTPWPASNRDVLAHARVRFLVVMEGINDFGHAAPGTPEAVTAADIIQATSRSSCAAHAHGIKVYGATLTPYRGTIFPGYFNEIGELNRLAVNHWIRTSGAYDAVIDFEAVVRDPADPSRMLPAYDVGDHLHPNDAAIARWRNRSTCGLFDDDDHDHGHHGAWVPQDRAPRPARERALTCGWPARPDDGRHAGGPARAAACASRTAPQIAPATPGRVGEARADARLPPSTHRRHGHAHAGRDRRGGSGGLAARRAAALAPASTRRSSSCAAPLRAGPHPRRRARADHGRPAGAGRRRRRACSARACRTTASSSPSTASCTASTSRR